MTAVRDTPADAATADNNDDRSAPCRGVQLARWVAVIAGLAGFVASALIPVLPVVQTTAALNWPQHDQLGSVTAPLIALTPLSLDVSVPCGVIDTMPDQGGLVFGTAPAAGKQATLNGLFVTVTEQRVDVIVRNVAVLSVPRSRITAQHCQRLEVSSSEAGTFATVVGLTDPDTGEPLRGGFADPNLRPQIVGIFTDLTGPAPPGLSASATIDTRYTSSPTPLKLAAMLVGMTATAVALLALWRLDRLDQRRARRLIPMRRGSPLSTRP